MKMRDMTRFHLPVLMLLLSVMAAVNVSICIASTVSGGGYNFQFDALDKRPQHDYVDALSKCILFFEGQRSGKLPSSQRMKWRKDSALEDGHDIGVDLVGGYYDAGDNLKFGFPMAFTATVLSWSVIEFSDDMDSELNNALDAIRWVTDYLLKATIEPNKVYAGVGDPLADHNCWERPEDMDTPRTVYSVDTQRPGSEVAAETAAALAAASIVFKNSDPAYSDILLKRSFMVFEFADSYRGSYNDSLGGAVCPFYCNWSGYTDELIWGAAWIYKASNGSWYWDYVINHLYWLESEKPEAVGEFGWDDKHAGVYVLLYKDFVKSLNETLYEYHNKAKKFACTVLPESPTKSVSYTPGGLLYRQQGSNIQNAAARSFLLIVLARYLNEGNHIVDCVGGVTAPSSRLIELAKSQADYILGDNPLNMSYMVGYSDKFPLRIHHRGSSLPSIDAHPNMIPCKNGTQYSESNSANPNLLTGAIVGGPTKDDKYPDSRVNFVESEPTTYINAPMVGVFAYFSTHG